LRKRGLSPIVTLLLLPVPPVNADTEQDEVELASGLGKTEQDRPARLRLAQVEGLVITAHGDVIAGGGRERATRRAMASASPDVHHSINAPARASSGTGNCQAERFWDSVLQYSGLPPIVNGGDHAYKQNADNDSTKPHLAIACLANWQTRNLLEQYSETLNYRVENEV
jgi:hypothetical protein